MISVSFRAWHRDEIFVCTWEIDPRPDPRHREVTLPDESSAPPARLQLDRKLPFGDDCWSDGFWPTNVHSKQPLVVFLERLGATMSDVSKTCDDPRFKELLSADVDSMEKFATFARKKLRTLEDLVFFFKALLDKVSSPLFALSNRAIMRS